MQMAVHLRLIAPFVAAILLAPALSIADIVRDVRYGERARNVFDLYMPVGVGNPPLLVFVHGGRWFRNDKTQIERHDRIDALTDAGIAIASINYSFSSEMIWPAQREDLSEALGFLRRRADEFGYDGSRIAVWGQSSGAHLALWAALDAAREPETRLQALVSWYAPSDLYALIPDRAADDVPDRGDLDQEPTPESLLIGAEVAEHKTIADTASPITQLKMLPKGLPLPPTLLVHGTADFVVSPLQTDRLHDAMMEQGGAPSVELRRVEDAGHGGDAFDTEVAPVIDFLKSAFDVP